MSYCCFDGLFLSYPGKQENRLGRDRRPYRAISELSHASVSKQGVVQSHCYENNFSFSCK